MTPDVDRLRSSLDQLHDLVKRLKFEFVNDPQWAKPSESSYLTDAHRADPNIMANIEAMEATNKLIAWFGRDFEGYVGLWRGPTGLPFDEAPVVRLDSEGQYSLVAATVPEYLAISVRKEAFEDSHVALIAVGFGLRSSRKEIWAAIDRKTSPNEYRHALFNEGRARRGLEAI
jgi:hypothetical protein